MYAGNQWPWLHWQCALPSPLEMIHFRALSLDRFAATAKDLEIDEYKRQNV